MAEPPYTVNIASGDGMTPAELQAKLESGKLRRVDPDEKVDLTKDSKFVTINKDHEGLRSYAERLDYITEGIFHDLPAGGLKHRILDKITSTPMAAKQKAFFHHSHHFALGPDASQMLLMFAKDADFLEQHQQYCPHPFDGYTVSLWSGSEDGMVEVLLLVSRQAHGYFPEIATLPWGEERPQWHGHNDEGEVFSRENSLRPDAPAGQRLSWKFCDAFRMLLAQKRGVTVNKGPGNRTAVRKGKRVTFYSKSEITIDLDAVEREQIVARTGYGHMMPVYQYRAHLCHSGGQKGCEHYWIELGGHMTDQGWIPDNQFPRANATWECYHCGRRRWHRKAGTRGSAEIGYVQQTYKVKKGKDDE